MEICQIATNTKAYFKDRWNYLDLIRTITSFIWIGLELIGLKSLYFRWVIALVNLIRGITVFWLFDGTRFYINLIFTTMNDIKYFFLMFAYSTFIFGFLMMISRGESLSFNSIWEDSFDLNFGNYEDSSGGIFFLQYIAYFTASVVNVVLMLNLLISILGDSYQRLELNSAVLNIRVKARISKECQSMMFWAKKESDLKYLEVCNFAFEEEREQDWDSRIKIAGKKLDKAIDEIGKTRYEIAHAMAEIKNSANSRTNQNSECSDATFTVKEKFFEDRFALLEERIENMLNKSIHRTQSTG